MPTHKTFATCDLCGTGALTGLAFEMSKRCKLPACDEASEESWKVTQLFSPDNALDSWLRPTEQPAGSDEASVPST